MLRDARSAFRVPRIAAGRSIFGRFRGEEKPLVTSWEAAAGRPMPSASVHVTDVLPPKLRRQIWTRWMP